ALLVLRLQSFAWYGYQPGPPQMVIVSLLKTSCSSLSGILLPYVFASACPPYSSIAPFCSLVLHVAGPECAAFSTVLSKHHDAFPLLTYCKLWFAWTPTSDIHLAAELLRRKPSLKCLDFTNMGKIAYRSDLSNEPVLSILRELPLLRVFGCSLFQDDLTSDHVMRLGRYVPRNLDALSMLLCVSKTAVSDTDWEQLFKGCSSCRYLHIRHEQWLGLRHFISRCLPDSVELLGYDHDLRWVLRESVTGDVSCTDSWPPTRVLFATANDFGCKEWKWLFRHHGPTAWRLRDPHRVDDSA
ncbi:hypothetical protein BD311DRAFT_826893, partial [Dichomitus squalens]